VTETSRLSTQTQALATLGEARARPDHDAITACGRAIEATSADFRAAVADASARGDTLPPAGAVAAMTALARCRRLGFTLSLLGGQPPPVSAGPRGYTPGGRPAAAADGGTFLTARG
jgi:hypothetical protein